MKLFRVGVIVHISSIFYRKWGLPSSVPTNRQIHIKLCLIILHTLSVQIITKTCCGRKATHNYASNLFYFSEIYPWLYFIWGQQKFLMVDCTFKVQIWSGLSLRLSLSTRVVLVPPSSGKISLRKLTMSSLECLLFKLQKMIVLNKQTKFNNNKYCLNCKQTKCEQHLHTLRNMIWWS